MISASVPTATQAEAEAGTINDKAMTPLRVTQAIDALGISQTVLASANGAGMVGFGQNGMSAVRRSVESRLRDTVNVRDFGAIGDGTSHPVSEWVPSRFASLAAIQVAYPDVRSLDDEIDFAAINAAVRFGAASGAAIRIPAGLYLGWIYAHYDNVAILGDGAAVTTIKLPNGARRETPNNNNGSGAWVEGTPCVVEFNSIGHGNEAVPMSSGHISGLTLDGNAAGTDVPGEDLHGWGLAFTAYSNVTYHDINVVNTHCGGVGTFINSNYHIGASRSYNCGHSNVSGGTRPGWDVNSSKYSIWNHVSRNDAYGVRMIDNCFGNNLSAVVHNATRTGVVYGNQSVNMSHSNIIDATVNGGCLDYGMTVGGDCSSSKVTLVAQGVTGDSFRSVAQGTASDDSRGSKYDISSRSAGGRCAYIQGSNDRYTIASTEDGRGGPQGSVFAVDVEGDKNIIDVVLNDTDPWHVRGIAFRPSASDNKLLAYTWTNTADPFFDAGANNIWRDRLPSWIAPALLNNYVNAGGDYPDVGYYKDADGFVHLRGLLTGGTAGDACFNLPAGFRPAKNFLTTYADQSGAAKIQIGFGGAVQPLTGTTYFALDGISFPTRN